MNDYLRKFDDSLPSTQADFHVSESYRWVRIGMYCLMAGYLVLLPGLVVTVLQTALFAKPETLVLLLGVASIFLGAGLIALGGVFLLKSPQQNERETIQKFFIAYGIAIGCVILSRVFDIGGLGIVKNISQAYGTYFLINFFEVLAANRQNETLQRSSSLLNRWYIFGLMGLFAISLVGGMLGIPLAIILIALAVFGVAFYVLWIRTLWLAIKSTSFIRSDSTRAF